MLKMQSLLYTFTFHQYEIQLATCPVTVLQKEYMFLPLFFCLTAQYLNN